jgi:hypothetical protein
MFVKNLILSSFLGSVLFFSACKENGLEPPADKCSAKNLKLSASVVNAASCSSNGSLIVRASGSNGFTFKLGSGAFQSDSVFAGLAAGSYTITVQDFEGCTKTETFIVGENPFEGPLFSAVKSLVATKCSQTCHTSGSGGAPKNIFATNCDIVALKSMIVVKSVNSSMGNLNTAEKAKITDWIAAGGTINK